MDDQDKHILHLYKRLAGSEFLPMLEDMLYELKFTVPCKSEGDMALNNYAKELLVKVFGDERGVVSSMSFFDKIRNLVRRKK